MLKIKYAQNMPFLQLAPNELFCREEEKQSIYYSFLDKNGSFTAVNLTTGEEAKKLSPNEVVIRIQGTLTITG